MIAAEISSLRWITTFCFEPPFAQRCRIDRATWIPETMCESVLSGPGSGKESNGEATETGSTPGKSAPARKSETSEVGIPDWCNISARSQTYRSTPPPRFGGSLTMPVEARTTRRERSSTVPSNRVQGVVADAQALRALSP